MSNRRRSRAVAPVVASAAAWGGGAVLHAALPPSAAPIAATAAAGLTGGTLALAAWHSLPPARRLWATAAAGWGTGWTALAAAGAAHGPPGAIAVAGAGLLALPWLARDIPRDEPKAAQPHAAPSAERELRADWAAYVSCQDGPLPGTVLRNVKGVPSGLASDVELRRGKQTVSVALRQAEAVASGLDLPLTRVIMEPAPDGNSSRARLTVLERDVLADCVPWDGPEINPETGLITLGRYFDGADAHGRLLLPGSGPAHWIAAGTTGAGKSTLVFTVIASITHPACPVPVVPFIIDPEEGGQSTIAWKGLRYRFCGEEQALAALYGLDAVMSQRSTDMAAEGLDYFDPSGERPMIFSVLEEASAMLSESPWKAEAVRLVTRYGKRFRKRGGSLMAVTPVPSLDEIDSQVFRGMMRSGTAVCFRTEDPVSGGMLGFRADPSLLPQVFADGSPAYGVCLIKGPDGREAPLRTRYLSKEAKAQIAAGAADRRLDERSERAFWNAYEACMARLLDGAADEQQPAPAAPATAAPAATAAPIDPTTTAAAILKVLADGAPRSKGEIMTGVRFVTTSPSTVQQALGKLAADGLVAKPGERKPYTITDAGRARLENAA